MMLLVQSRVFHSLLAWSLLLYPYAAAKAQTPSSPVVSPAFLTSESVAAVCVRPQQVLTNPALQMLPVEVAQAAGEKYLGMDPANISRAIVVAEPPMGMTPFYAVFLQSSQPFDLARLSPELTQHTQPGQLGGRGCLVSSEPALPCFMVLNQKTLVAASQGMLEKLLDRNRPKASGVLADLLASQSAGDDLYLAVNLEALRPLIQMGLMAGAKDVPPEFQKFLQIPTLLQSAEGAVNLDPSRRTRLLAHAGTASDADRLQALIAEGMEVAQAKMKEDMEEDMSRLRNSEDPVERAAAAYMDRISESYAAGFSPQRTENSLVLFESDPEQAQQMASVAVIGILIALLLPAVQAAREAARRNQAMNNMKELLLSMHNYHDTYGHFPSHAIYSDDGKPLLSWRVALLPFLEEQRLYDQFHMDESWDSPHNLELAKQMPAVFLEPSSPIHPEQGLTHFMAPVGEGFLFENKKTRLKFSQLTDGASPTMALLQVSDSAAVPWTKPVDWNYDPEEPLRGLGGLHPGIFLAGFADGRVMAIAETINPQLFHAKLTRAGGEPQ